MTNKPTKLYETYAKVYQAHSNLDHYANIPGFEDQTLAILNEIHLEVDKNPGLIINGYLTHEYIVSSAANTLIGLRLSVVSFTGRSITHVVVFRELDMAYYPYKAIAFVGGELNKEALCFYPWTAALLALGSVEYQ